MGRPPPRSFAVATPHRLASEAAVEIVRMGGNAVDAAIAANAVLTVVYPHMCSIGGDVMALLTRPDASTVAIDGSGAWPRGLDAQMRADDWTMPITGPPTVTVPGTLHAWGMLLELGGGMPLDTLLGPAVALSLDGVPVSRSLGAALSQLAQGGGSDAFPPGFRTEIPLREGEAMRQIELGTTLAALADGGFERFYRGSVAARIVAGLRDAGSLISAADLAAHETRVAAPLRVGFRDREILTTPPNSQGALLLQLLAAIEVLGEPLDLDGEDAAVVAALFQLVGARRDELATASRRRLSPEALRATAGALVAEARSATEVRTDPRPGRLPETQADTVAVVTADADGWRVVLIQSLFHYFGSRVFDEQLGILYQNRGAYGSADPDSPARFGGGRRPVHTLMPVIVERNGAATHLCGTMGGTAQPQILAQLIVRMLTSDDPLDAIVGAPRWFVGGVELGDPADVVRLEPGLEPVAAALARAGHRIDFLAERSEAVGHSQPIRIYDDGGLEAGSDPRADGLAAWI